MPNYVDSKLTIVVPSNQSEALLAAIAGPEDWAIPVEAFHERERPKVSSSNHTRIQILNDMANIDKVIADFKKHMAPSGWPEWMKPSQTDLEVFLAEPARIETKQVDFSVVKLAPWKSKEEFNSFFKDHSPEHHLWTPAPQDQGGYSSPIISLRNFKIGPKWPPSSIEMDVQKGNKRHTISITFTTPNSPLENIVELLEDTCRAHGAKFLMTWVEEQGYCGYTYCNPAADETTSDEYGVQNPWMVEVEEEDGDDDDDYTYTQFDRIEFETTISDTVGDPDL